MQMDKQGADGQEHLRYSSRSSNTYPRPSDKKDKWDFRNHRGSGDQSRHREYTQAWRDEIHHREKHDDDHRGHSARPENPSLKEEMKKERMVITVSQALALPSDIRVKEDKELQTIGSHSKVKAEDADDRGKKSKDSKERDEAEDEIDDSSDSDHGKKEKVKSPKKKRKKKNKKKKEKKSKS